jgi:UDP-GlcNAc:undecaprenyl-phosphate GlcNAc-1-phosphate transferase
MPTFFVLGASAFLICLIATPLCRNLFLRAGLVDPPDKDRKFHKTPVPRLGGVPIVLSYAAALVLMFVFNPGGGTIYVQHDQLFHALVPGAAIIFLIGLVDDLLDIKPWQKLAGQLTGAIVAVSLGARISSHHFNPVVGGVLSVFWLVGCTNAVNLIDGMDGLATGVGLLATLTTLGVALISGNHGLAMATVPLAACLLAFLRYNFAPATIFLGDCGSLTIGFVLGCFGLIWSQGTGTWLGMIAPLMALALPLIDVGLAIGRRFLRSAPIFKGDRGHIHHKILGLGFSTGHAALLLYGVCALFASLALLAGFTNKLFALPVLLLFCCLVFAGVNHLGYIEFAAARKVLTGGMMQRTVSDEIYLHEFHVALRRANSIDLWWETARKCFIDLGFASADLELYGRSYHEHFIPTRKTSCRINLDLGGHGSLMLTRPPEKHTPKIMMATLKQLQDSIEEGPILMSRPARSAGSLTDEMTSNVA